MTTRKTKSVSKKELAEARRSLERTTLAIYHSGAEGSLLSRLVSRVCAGMDDGDRFYNASDDSWWEWRGGELRGSGPPVGYGKIGSACVLCKRGFPKQNGVHYGSATLGRIQQEACTDGKGKRR